MRVLNEKEQLQNEINNVCSSINYENYLIDELNSKINKYEDRWFKNKGTLRVMKGDLERKERTLKHLYSYRDSLDNRFKNIKNDEPTEE